LSAAKTLDMYAVAVEGGKALLLVPHSGQGMLLDAGNAGQNGRDVNRIVEARKAAGVKKIDYMVVTDYDGDRWATLPRWWSASPSGPRGPGENVLERFHYQERERLHGGGHFRPVEILRDITPRTATAYAGRYG
jgi:glyoxylase-like metal-dependent hydrolase (beta-lactamase superfamily II)